MKRRSAEPSDKKLTVTVSRPIWERLRQIALQEDRSLNDILNDWLAAELERRYLARVDGIT